MLSVVIVDDAGDFFGIVDAGACRGYWQAYNLVGNAVGYRQVEMGICHIARLSMGWCGVVYGCLDAMVGQILSKMITVVNSDDVLVVDMSVALFCVWSHYQRIVD